MKYPMNIKFNMNDRVEIFNTSSELDGLHGRIVGIATHFADMDHFIVLFDNPVDAIGSLAIQITEHCLRGV